MDSPTIRTDESRSTVLRAIVLLKAFTPADTSLGLSELSRRAGYPKSTTYRLANDLVGAGLLEHGAYGYRLGLRLFELGHLVPALRRLREAAMPFLQDLRDLSGLTVNLAVTDGTDVIYVEKLPHRGANVSHTRAGGRLPLHCTALGKAMLAFLPQSKVLTCTDGHLQAYTEKSITDPAKLQRALTDVRRVHVAYDNEESRIGLCCVASPVFGQRGLVGAISATGNLGVSQSARVSSLVSAIARTLSRSIG